MSGGCPCANIFIASWRLRSILAEVIGIRIESDQASFLSVMLCGVIRFQACKELSVRHITAVHVSKRLSDSALAMPVMR